MLYNDSTLEWYNKVTDKKPIGTIVLRDVFESIFLGEFTRCMSNRPNLPNKANENLLGNELHPRIA